MNRSYLLVCLLLGVSACSEAPADDALSGTPGPYVPTSDPTACELWRSVTPPADFDGICRPTGEDLSVLERSMWDMINADRVEHAEEANFAAPLTYDCAVAEVARMHSYDQCKSGTLAHELHGRGPGDRLEQYLQIAFGGDFWAYAENVAWYPNLQLQEAEDGFVESEPPCDWELGGHRLNILSEDFEATGVGYCACAGEPNFYVTQNFITFDVNFPTPGHAFCDANFPDFPE
jgi:uncharacterized protein YkwD